MAGTEASGAPLGRPRDPDVDRRVATAAIELFGEAGWAGFSVEAVARRAGVGKASVYLRWADREDLLIYALRSRIGGMAEVDTGSLRDDLVEMARQMLELYLGIAGPAAMRLGLEVERFPALRERHHALGDSQRLAARAVVRRAIERRELPPGTSVTLLLNTLCGGALFHAMSAVPGTRDRVQRGSGAYAERLADFVLRAAVER
jgi:AcrR family transcriptional regulator